MSVVLLQILPTEFEANIWTHCSNVICAEKLSSIRKKKVECTLKDAHVRADKLTLVMSIKRRSIEDNRFVRCDISSGVTVPHVSTKSLSDTITREDLSFYYVNIAY